MLGARLSNQKQFYVGTCLLSILISIFTVTFSFMNRYVVPPSGDSGNWLTQVNILYGVDVTGYGLRYPPLFFFLLAFLLRYLSEFMALKIAGSIVSTIIGIPFFFLARRLSGDVPALLCTLLFVFSGGYSETRAWGGYPQFLGIFFMLWALYFFINSLETSSKKNIFFTSLFSSFIVGAHHLTAFFFLFAAGVFILLILCFSSTELLCIIKKLLISIVTFLILSLPYLPIYWNLYNRTVFEFDSVTLRKLLDSGLYVFRESPLLWGMIFALGVIVLIHLWKEKKNIRVALTSLAMSSFILSYTGFFGNPHRPLYFLNIPILLSYSVFLEYAWKKIGEAHFKKLLKVSLRLLFILFVISTTIILVFSSLTRLSDTVEFYHCIKDNELEGLNWIRHNTQPDDIIATSGSKKAPTGASYGWWIEGYSKRKCLFSSDLKYFIFKDEKEAVSIANQIFSSNQTLSYELIKVYGINYIFLSKERTDEYYSFLNDTKHFKISFENEGIIIFQCKDSFVDA